MSKFDEMVKDLCPNGIEYKPLWSVTIWDKKFNTVDKSKQNAVRKYKYLLAADLGMDHVNVYRLNHDTGKLTLVDVVRSELESAPRHLVFSTDGKFMYVVHELKNYIEVYTYEERDNKPYFEKIQRISTVNSDGSGVAASALKFSWDHEYLLSSNAGDNSVILYNVDTTKGTLEQILCLPISGEYPKDAALFPDCRHLVSLNHESNSLTFFTVNKDEKTIVMNGPAVSVDKPNCVLFHKIG